MQILSRWRLKKDKRWQKLKDKIAETAETEKDEIAETAETEKDEIADTAMREFTETARQHGKNTVYRSRFTERFTANTVYREPRDCNMYRDYEFTESQETVTCRPTETVRVH